MVLDSGREAETLELFCDVARGLFRAGRARATAFELVGGEVVDVGAQSFNVGDVVLDDPLLRDGEAGDRRKDREREKKNAELAFRDF